MLIKVKLFMRLHGLSMEPEEKLTCGEAQVIFVALDDNAGKVLLIEGNVPSHSYVLAALRLLHHAIVLRLQLHQRSKYILICICIIIPAQQCLATLRRKVSAFVPGGFLL